MKKKIGGMQPYLFPYLGYFQLIGAVDVFVLSDDLQHIERGWVNRNRILMNGRDALLTFPLKKDKHWLKINERVLSDVFPAEMEKILRTLRGAYAKAPRFREVMPFLEEIIRHPEKNLAKYAENSIRKICHYLEIKTPIVVGSELCIDGVTDKTDRVIKLVKQFGGDTCINPIGGRELYDVQFFKTHGIELKFHRMGEIKYRQFDNEFVPYLSIIDLLMFNDVPELQVMLSRYSLLEPQAGLERPGEQPDFGHGHPGSMETLQAKKLTA